VGPVAFDLGFNVNPSTGSTSRSSRPLLGRLLLSRAAPSAGKWAITSWKSRKARCGSPRSTQWSTRRRVAKTKSAASAAQRSPSRRRRPPPGSRRPELPHHASLAEPALAAPVLPDGRWKSRVMPAGEQRARWSEARGGSAGAREPLQDRLDVESRPAEQTTKGRPAEAQAARNGSKPGGARRAPAQRPRWPGVGGDGLEMRRRSSPKEKAPPRTRPRRAARCPAGEVLRDGVAQILGEGRAFEVADHRQPSRTRASCAETVVQEPQRTRGRRR